MLEKQLREANHKEMQGFVSRSSHPLRNGYVSVEELVRESSHNKSGLFQPLFFFPLRHLFTKRQDHSPHKLPAAHHNLGS
jgi:hypothetical protein